MRLTHHERRRPWPANPAPWRRPRTTRFDVAYLNLAGELSPSAIVQALDRRGRGNLCFYGLPGTGKTPFAEVLAEALDREQVASQASDLITKWVGETEHTLARLFRDADPQRTLLLLNEVNSFLLGRRQAEHGWERTQVYFKGVERAPEYRDRRRGKDRGYPSDGIPFTYQD